MNRQRWTGGLTEYIVEGKCECVFSAKEGRVTEAIDRLSEGPASQ